jgi:hypothetical protein
LRAISKAKDWVLIGFQLDRLKRFLRKSPLPNRSESGEGALLPDVSSPLSDLQLAGLTNREKERSIMYQLVQFKTITPPLLITLALLCFGLLPKVQAVGPDTEGNIPGANNGEGVGVLVSRTSGVWNTGTGFETLNNLTVGNQNTATGLRALFSDTGGGFNTATGVYALFSNTTGFFNSATGAYSLTNNTIGNYNTANGYSALYFNTEGFFNTATGFAALHKNTTGFSNTATGLSALSSNTTGFNNTATGDSALESNTNWRRQHGQRSSCAR